MRKKTWDKLSPAKLEIIQEAANESKVYEGTVAREQDAKAVDQLKEAGVQFYEVASQDARRYKYVD